MVSGKFDSEAIEREPEGDNPEATKGYNLESTERNSEGDKVKTNMEWRKPKEE